MVAEQGRQGRQLAAEAAEAAATPTGDSQQRDAEAACARDGRRAALHWAMTDQPPPSSPLIALQSPTACAELRQCIQHCYALSLSRRYNKAKDAASQPRSNK